ncbi:MAG: EAL domain-containing protein [Lachnospiraceae bacterium]|nr:EAL domain-containing protein [Lachnospiraceae bacterium]
MERYEYSSEMRDLLENSPVPFAIYQFVDRRVVTLILTEGFCRMFGYDDPAKAYYDMDHNMYKETHPDDAARIADAAFEFATKGGRYDVIYRSKTGEGADYRIIHALGEHFNTDTGEQLAQVWYMDEGIYTPEGAKEKGLSQSLSRTLHEASFIRASYYDYLTGLPSMTYFFELAESGCQAISDRGGKPTLLFLDLSGMKYFNQKHGFAEGDVLLRSFSQLIVKYFSNENCCRLGQDHFAVYTDETYLEDTLHRMFQEWQSTGSNKTLPIRVGVYPDCPKDMDVSMACDRARLACDALKNTYVSGIHYYDDEMQEDVDKHQYIISNIDRAIEEGWIKVYYQPIVRAINGRVCDEEALSRWIDPVKGFLSPGDFIPILEESGLIYKLDLYIVDQVIEKIKKTEEAGLNVVPQSVNLSRSDFDACDLVGEISKRVNDAGIKPEMITIEVTESIVGSDFEFMKKQVGRFRKLGFQVWMDDFGSGYSSLDVLRDLEFDLIKFDMSFMRRLDEGDTGKIILTELMRMASALGMETVCEGVETKEHATFLREIGCSKLQGYYYSKPIPFEDILERYEKGIQIGYENPEESGYYESIGRINLYDLAVVASEGEDSFRHLFNTLPMAIMEIERKIERNSITEKALITRSNQSFRDFTERSFGYRLTEEYVDVASENEGDWTEFVRRIVKCGEDINRTILDERLPDRTIAHILLRKISRNHVNGHVAVAIAVMAVTDHSGDTSYANISRALAADYFNLFYVDLDTEEFIEYTSEIGEESMAVERHGKGFFKAARRDALNNLYIGDIDTFVSAFTKENVEKTLDEQGSFTLTYRLMQKEIPIYVNMNIMRMADDGNHIIIGVRNVDTQMKKEADRERLQREKVMYSRISALAGNYIAMYTVDPDTDHFIVCSATSDYEELGLAVDGEDFYGQSMKDMQHTIYREDLPRLEREFTKENVMAVISEKGVFETSYRLMIEDDPMEVRLRAVLVKETDGEKLIVGVNR